MGRWGDAMRFASSLIAVALVTACAPMPPPSPALLARCTTLYTLWFRYENHPTYHHTGQRARAEYALYQCQQGDYAPGVAELERLLIRGKIPVPPP